MNLVVLVRFAGLMELAGLMGLVWLVGLALLGQYGNYDRHTLFVTICEAQRSCEVTTRNFPSTSFLIILPHAPPRKRNRHLPLHQGCDGGAHQ